MRIYLSILFLFIYSNFSAYAKTNLNDFNINTNAYETQLIIAATNDIHGVMESSSFYNRMVGGLDYLNGYIDILRSKYTNVFLLDAGDTFQGTLLSNYYQGKPLIDIMNKLEYTAAIAGNHGFDYGSLEDDYCKLSVLKQRIKDADFPYLGANIYEKHSLKYLNGNKINWPEIEKQINLGIIEKKDFEKNVDWFYAKNPRYIRPYIIKHLSHNLLFLKPARVVIIGLEDQDTPNATYKEYVASLYFRDEIDTYNNLYKHLNDKNKADIYIALTHLGARSEEPNFPAKGPAVELALNVKANTLDAIISAHSHSKVEQITAGIPIIQSYSNGRYFGKILLTFNHLNQRVNRDKTRLQAAIPILNYISDNKPAIYLGQEVVPDLEIKDIIEKYKKDIDPIANRILAITETNLVPNRINESNLGNFITDALRKEFNADIAMINSGGIRSVINSGYITYDNLYKSLPFDNRGVYVENISLKKLISVFKQHTKSCGEWGGLQVSGIKLTYSRDCTTLDGRGGAIRSELIKIETEDGKLLYEKGDIILNQNFSLATIDFLIKGGRYTDLHDLKIALEGDLLRSIVDRYFSRFGPTHVFRIPYSEKRLVNLIP